MASFTSGNPRQRKGALIEWHELNFTVLDQATGQQKRILNDMSGLAQPGRLLSIMGPSGAGKSTLLDVLACNSSSRGATMEGTITVDGQPRNTRQFTRISCYVQQKDVLLSSATVREVVMTSALLKLPRSVPQADKRALVEATLKELDLTPCANTLIGDETIGLKGISGGQKRRVSVGVELVKDPRVLFLDEPSSGLDSEMAYSVMLTLVRLARRGRTVVCTIHQPNSDITDCFDDFLLLAEGRVVYGGLWSGAVDFFAQAGFSCPSFKNPTDYFMSVVTRDEAAVETLASAYAKARVALLQQMKDQGQAQAAATDATFASPAQVEARNQGKLSPQQSVRVRRLGGRTDGDNGAAEPAAAEAAAAAAVGTWTNAGSAAGLQGAMPRGSDVVLEVKPAAVTGCGGGSSSAPTAATATATAPASADSAAEDKEAGEQPAGVPLWFQVAVLSQRYWRTWIRNPVMMTSELVQYVFTAVFIGLMYHDFGNELGQGDYNRASCIWFSLAVLSFTPSYTAVTNWASERLLLKRELGQRLYGIGGYYFARYSVVIPFQLAQCLLFLCVMYFFAGFQASAAGFFTFFAIFSMFQIISEGLGACCAVVTGTPTNAIILLTFLLLVLLAFSGFLTTKVPVYFTWVQKTSYLSYASSSLVEREFSQITFTDPATGEVVPGMQAFPPSLRTGLSYSQNVGILAAQVAGMEIIKLTAFYVAHRFNLM